MGPRTIWRFRSHKWIFWSCKRCHWSSLRCWSKVIQDKETDAGISQEHSLPPPGAWSSPTVHFCVFGDPRPHRRFSQSYPFLRRQSASLGQLPAHTHQLHGRLSQPASSLAPQVWPTIVFTDSDPESKSHSVRPIQSSLQKVSERALRSSLYGRTFSQAWLPL